MFNNVVLGTATNKSLLARADASVMTCADVMLIFADRLSMRVGASKNETIVMSSGDEKFDISLKIGREGAAVTLNIQKNCESPINATYGKGAKSGEGNFQDLESLLRWLVQNLKV
jgi:hypothetical protein